MRAADVRRHWREAVLAACATWLVVQNIIMFVILAWTHPVRVLAVGATVAQVTWQAAAALCVFGAALAFLVTLVAALRHITLSYAGGGHDVR